MSKSKSSADKAQQMTLFDRLMAPSEPMEEDFCVDFRLRQALRRDIQKSGKDHFQIAYEMSRLLDVSDYEVSKSIIDSWTRSDAGWNIPAKALAAFCQVTGAMTVLQVILEPLGKRLAAPGEDQWSEIGKLKLEIMERNERIKQLLKAK